MRGLKIFGIAFLMYLLVSIYSILGPGPSRDLISGEFDLSMLYTGLVWSVVFFLVFSMGYLSRFQLGPFTLTFLFLLLSFHDPPVAPILAVFAVLFRWRGIDLTRFFPGLALLVAFLLPSILYLFVGVPLVNRSLRYELVGPLVLAAVLAVIGIVYSELSPYRKAILVVGYIFLFYMGTFRSLVLLVFLAYSLQVYFNRNETGSVHLPLILGFLLFPLILIMSGGSHAIIIRVGFTFLIFQNIVAVSLPWGFFHGALLLSDNPRHMVASLFGASTNYTYFFFGQPIADFGVFGLIEAFFLGVLLRQAELKPRSFVSVLSLMLYSIDPGVDSTILMFVLGILLFDNDS